MRWDRSGANCEYGESDEERRDSVLLVRHQTIKKKVAWHQFVLFEDLDGAVEREPTAVTPGGKFQDTSRVVGLK